MLFLKVENENFILQMDGLMRRNIKLWEIL